ncbi:unnamed protein product [Discosporangium mesarthrocarpum]
MFEDNEGAVKLTRNSISDSRSRAKHADIKYHVLRSSQRNGDVDVRHVKTADQRADPLSKTYPKRGSPDIKGF